MIFRLLMIAFVCLSSSVPQKSNGYIQWQSLRRLTWGDFKAAPPANASNAALTSSNILIKFSTDGETLKYEISCNFDPNTSWGRVKNDHILSHEQGHFDIAELHARKLNKALKAYRLRANSVSKDINAIYQATMDELMKMQALYDQETDYSRNVIQQKAWVVKIDNYMADLQQYANYHQSSS